MPDFPNTPYNPAIDALTVGQLKSTKTNNASYDHAVSHKDEVAEIQAVEAKVGLGASTPVSNAVLIGNGVGTSEWDATPTVTSLTTTGAIVSGTSITSGTTIASGTTLTAGTSLAVTTSATVGSTLGVTGLVTASGGLTMASSKQQIFKGADVASGTNITLSGGNVFDITGTTTINTIAATGWQAGSVVHLQFDSTVTIAHDAAGTGARIWLAGATNYSAFANDTLTLYYDGTYWHELARSSSRKQGYQGANVSSASTITLTQGNFFSILGTTTIDNIVADNWETGSVIYLKFNDSIQITDDAAGSGVRLFLAGTFNATANDTLTLVFDGTQWLEVSRSVN